MYEELSYKVRGCAFEVYNRLGFGHKESVYQKAFAEELRKNDIPFEREKSLSINYRGKCVGGYRPDFVIDGKLIVEIKAVKMMPKSYERQLIHYLKSTGYKLGFLINFGSKNIDIRRRVWSLDYQRKSAINRCASVLALLAAAALFSMFGKGATYAQVTAGQVGLEVSPLSVEKEVKRGEEVTFAVKFRNPLDEVQYIRPKFKDMRVYASGEVTFLDYSSPRYTISRWASFPKDVIELGPKQEKSVPITVQVPKDATIGGHFGGVFGEARVKDEDGAFRGPYAVKQRVAPGTLVLLSVVGEDVLGAATDWQGDLHLNVEGVKVGGVYLASRPVQLNVTFGNRSIFHQNVWGGLFIKSTFWGGEQSFRLREKKALPEAQVSYSKTFTPKRIFGKYNAQVKMAYGENGEQEAVEETTLWVLNPWSFLIIALIPLAVVLWVKYRDKRQQE